MAHYPETDMFQRELITSIEAEFPRHTDPKRAEGAYAYMKGIAPFLGIDTPTRRSILKPIFTHLSQPTSQQLGRSAIALMNKREREYHYAAYDLIDFFNDCANRDFLSEFGERLITTKSWWDTVDGFGNAMVSRLTIEFPSRRLIQQWNNSQNRWLIRAAIQHQRGRREETEVEYVLKLCSYHATSREFFIAKAIGWALRDISRFDRRSVRRFLAEHPELSPVAVREALRYLE